MDLPKEEIREARAMSKKNYLYFKSHLNELLAQYHGKYVVIKNERIIGSYDDFDVAFKDTSLTENPGTFIIQHCISREEEESISFVSNNVVFV